MNRKMSAETFERYLLYLIADILGGLFTAIAINMFIVQADFAPGGVSGLAVIVNYLAGVPVGVATLLINVPIILFTFRRLGAGFFLRSLKTMIITSVITDLTAPYMPVYTGSRLAASLISGICIGIACGIVFTTESSFGSSDFVTMAVRKVKPELSIGTIAGVICSGVIVIAVFVFHDYYAFVLGILHTIVDAVVLDLVMKLLKRNTMITGIIKTA